MLYNTYRVRFNHPRFTFAQAVENSRLLFAVAREAGVERIVHVSITHADESSPLEYFHGKGQVEQLLRESGISYAILRPAVLFGEEGILINNIAWVLRRFPVFFLFGDLYVEAPPAGTTRFSDWARAEAAFGTRYESELARRFDRVRAYLPGA